MEYYNKYGRIKQQCTCEEPITNYEKIMSMDIDELVEWLYSFDSGDESPWFEWWNKKYCNTCENIIVHDEYLERNIERSWCELNGGRCKFFPELKKIPNIKQMLRLWLESEVK